MDYSLHKNERITSRLLMERLFKGNDSRAITAYPVRAIVLEVDHHNDDAAVQVLFSVSKRHFKHAVKRNRVKRQLREAYRLNKALLPEVAEGRQLLIAFIWLADKLYPTADIERRVVKLLQKM